MLCFACASVSGHRAPPRRKKQVFSSRRFSFRLEAKIKTSTLAISQTLRRIPYHRGRQQDHSITVGFSPEYLLVDLAECWRGEILNFSYIYYLLGVFLLGPTHNASLYGNTAVHSPRSAGVQPLRWGGSFFDFLIFFFFFGVFLLFG